MTRLGPDLGIQAYTCFTHRYGKFAVIDLLDIEDMWPVVVRKFDMVQQGLLGDLMSGTLLKENK